MSESDLFNDLLAAAKECRDARKAFRESCDSRPDLPAGDPGMKSHLAAHNAAMYRMYYADVALDAVVDCIEGGAK